MAAIMASLLTFLMTLTFLLQIGADYIWNSLSQRRDIQRGYIEETRRR